MRSWITKVSVSGFRSIKNMELSLDNVTVLVGPNGAGKSNLLWALELLRLLAFEALQLFVSQRGGATFLMHYGPRQTPAIDLKVEFRGEDGSENAYEARLGYGSDESLLFLVEHAGYRPASSELWKWENLGAGHRESRLRESAEKSATAKRVRWLLRQINFYHFHDTSRRSPLRTRSFNDTADNYLRSDGANLPAFLLTLREGSEPAAWGRILSTLQRVAPFVRDLTPRTDPRGVSLDWVDERGETFGPAHLSDGSLRALALITALAQPLSGMPILSCIDEPELGLHPAALEVICELIRSASATSQFIISTQSPRVLDLFSPSSIVVVERRQAASDFRRLDEAALAAWLDDYSLSELFDKNVIGGRP